MFPVLKQLFKEKIKNAELYEIKEYDWKNANLPDPPDLEIGMKKSMGVPRLGYSA